VNSTFSRLGLREAILDRHKDKSPPATQNCNTTRQPIDGLWVSGCINISAGGYLPFGDACPSDHRMIWIEIQYSVLFGHKSPELAKIQPKRLKTSDPRLVKRFHKRVKKATREQGLRKRFQAYKEEVDHSPWSELLVNQYDALNHEDFAIRATVESHIRKLHMGAVPWSPKLQNHCDTIELWRMIVRKRKHIKISVKRIRRFMSKTGIRDAMTCDLEQAEILLQQSYHLYKEAKKTAQLWRNDFLEDLAEDKPKQKRKELRLSRNSNLLST
jgi:hypothetical protein